MRRGLTQQIFPGLSLVFMTLTVCMITLVWGVDHPFASGMKLTADPHVPNGPSGPDHGKMSPLPQPHPDSDLLEQSRSRGGRTATEPPGITSDREAVSMAGVVATMDDDRAYQWLDSFLSHPPINCPDAERHEWITAILQGVHTNRLPVCKEILGLTACIISIESGFRADPLVATPERGGMPGLIARAEKELQRRMGSLFWLPPVPSLYEHYKSRYYPVVVACRTEGDVERVARMVARDLSTQVSSFPPVLRGFVENGLDKLTHVIRTKGSMQLSFNRVRDIMQERGEHMSDQQLSDYVYTREGGVDVGMAALKPMFVQYALRYRSPGDLSWLFLVGMDYHYGPFSSRNIMEQIRIRDLSGRQIPLDGDLLMYDDNGAPLRSPSQTLEAASLILPSFTRQQIFDAFCLEKTPAYVNTAVHRTINRLHRSRFGETPFAVIGDMWMGEEAVVKHGARWKTRLYLDKLDRYLNALPWDARFAGPGRGQVE